jgi:hypothetical protein
MELRRIVDSWEDDSRGLDKVPLTWHYELKDIVPNTDGFYEVPKSVHHVYPAMDAQRVLEKNGFIYVGHKKGNYDIELWRCAQEVAPQSDTTTIPGQSVVIHKDDAKALQKLYPELDNKEPTDCNLTKTDIVCPRCASRIASNAIRISDNHDRVKLCDVWLCMNPGCDFHYVTVDRIS